MTMTSKTFKTDSALIDWFMLRRAWPLRVSCLKNMLLRLIGTCDYLVASAMNVHIIWPTILNSHTDRLFTVVCSSFFSWPWHEGIQSNWVIRCVFFRIILLFDKWTFTCMVGWTKSDLWPFDLKYKFPCYGLPKYFYFI